MAPASILALVIGLGMLTAGSDEGGRTVLARGLFSYEAPAGWHVSDLNLTYPVSEGPMKDGFTPNIHVDVRTNTLPLAPFVSDNVRAAQTAPDFRLISETPFSTAAGLDGTRVIVSETVGAAKLRQIFYFFDAGAGQKIVVCASCLAKDGPACALVFDASLKTLSLE